jgi:hypothetical protein
MSIVYATTTHYTQESSKRPILVVAAMIDSRHKVGVGITTPP